MDLIVIGPCVCLSFFMPGNQAFFTHALLLLIGAFSVPAAGFITVEIN
jgi:hypothetical protein